MIHVATRPGLGIAACGKPLHTAERQVKPWCPECMLSWLPKMTYGATSADFIKAGLAARDGSVCFYCHVLLYTGQWLPAGENPPRRGGFVLIGGLAFQWATIDHFIPRAHGGSGRGDNLRLACCPCNTNKGDTIPGGTP